MFNTKCIVKIGEGNNNVYAIRKGVFGLYWYLDLKHPSLWWNKGSRWYIDCLSIDLNEVERLFKQISSKETVIKRA